jgi:acetylglutamate kinase
MKKKLHIIKIGGKLINDTRTLQKFLQILTTLEEPKILIHGGGRKATEMSALLGIETRIVDGRRITNQETLEVAVMVYAGWINKSIVASLQSMGVKALGLSGADADVITAHKREVKNIDYGFVGDIDAVDGHQLNQWLHDDITPVIAPVTHDGQGQLLNTNADTIAAQVAIAMSDHFEVSLSYCFEYQGVLYDIATPELTISTISQGEFINMKTSGSVNKGMIPKLSNGFDAVTGGVASVYICGLDNLISKEHATQLIP